MCIRNYPTNKLYETVLLEKLISTEAVKKFLALEQTEASVASITSCPEPNKSILPGGLSLSDFLPKILYAFLISCVLHVPPIAPSLI